VNERAGRRALWGIGIDVGGLTFLPFGTQIDYCWDDGTPWLVHPWATPEGFHLENWSDGVVLVYPA
jgi:hypothetical protein